MVSPAIMSVIASVAKQSSFSHDFPLLQRGIKGDFLMFLKSLLTSLFQREGLSSLVFLLSLFCINPTFATTSHNLYDAKGNMIASCGEKGCDYFIYQGVSRTGVVQQHQFHHQANGLDGKAGQMVRDQTGIKSSELWIPDFHGSVIAKLTKEKSETILFDAFGQVLNESTNLEDCKDYHYTDKPRVGCTALHNFNARFYDPKLGRFITSDPIEQHNLNWFVYANNNPLSFVDPTGMKPDNNTYAKALDMIQETRVELLNLATDIKIALQNRIEFIQNSPFLTEGDRRMLLFDLRLQEENLDQEVSNMERAIANRISDLDEEYENDGGDVGDFYRLLEAAEIKAAAARRNPDIYPITAPEVNTKVPGFSSSPSEQIRTETQSRIGEILHPRPRMTQAPASWTFTTLPGTRGSRNGLTITYEGDISEDAATAATLTAFVKILQKAKANQTKLQSQPVFVVP